MKLLGSLLFAAAVKADGHPEHEMGGHEMGGHEMGGSDMEALEDLVVETTAAPTSLPMEHSTGHHMEMMTHAMENHEVHHEEHHEESHKEEYGEPEINYEEEHHEEHHEEPHVKPCNSCGCNAEEMAQWKESMMVWKADHHGKSDFSVFFLLKRILQLRYFLFLMR